MFAYFLHFSILQDSLIKCNVIMALDFEELLVAAHVLVLQISLYDGSVSVWR